MKNVLLVLLGCIMICTPAIAQNCKPEEVTSYPGKWKPGMQGSINGVSAASLAKQKEIVTHFVKRLQQNMKLEGFNINYSGVYGYPNPALVKNRKMDAYELSMPLLPIYCENGQVKQAHETPYWVNIKINKIPHSGRESFFVQTTQYEEDFYTDVLYYLEHKPVKERSAWLLSEDFIGGFGKELTRYKWIIAYNDQLPFRHITRKELCTKLIDYYLKKARHTKIEDEINYNKKLVTHANDYLSKTSPEELNRPAKVRGSMLSVFYQYEDNVPPFYEDADKYSTYVIDIDPNYFKGSLPLHTPQIITLELTVDEKNVAVMNNMYKMLDALDIENLKTMLGNPNPFGKTNQPVKNTNQVKQPAPVVKKVTEPGAPAIKNKPATPDPKMQKVEFDPSKPVYDLSGNEYPVIKIGNQFWLKENLRTTKYNDSTAIATGLNDEQWKQTKSGAYTIYENNPLHEKTYGKLYNGYAVATGKLCPKGWRIPSDNDWKELEAFIGISTAELERTGERGEVAAKIKMPDGWKSSPFSGNNSTGFSIKPAGAKLDNGEFSTIGQFGNFWTSTVYDDRYGLLYLWNHHVNYNSNAVGRIYTLANNGYSCRCIKENADATKNPKP